MKKRKIRLLAAVLIIMQLFSGCSMGGKKVVVTSGVGRKDVFKIGGISCDVKEAKVYLANLQNIYGKSYGVDLWEQNFQTEELEKYVKDTALFNMTRMVCMELLAEEQEISLTQEEKEACERAAETYYASLNEAELSYTGVSKSEIEKMYKDYTLAQKVYHSLAASVNEEVSDDEARIMEAMQIYTKDEKKAKEAAEKLAAGEDFASVAGNYNQNPEIERVFGRGELPSDVEKAAFELENGEMTDCIKAEDGYYFIKCTNKFNVELTDENKLKIVEAREKKAFEDAYETFISELSSNMNEKVWSNIKLVTDGSIKTDSFFEVIEKELEN